MDNELKNNLKCANVEPDLTFVLWENKSGFIIWLNLSLYLAQKSAG